MSIRKLVAAAALLALPLCAAAEAPADCHQAAVVGPVELTAVGMPAALPLAAVGEVVLADGTRVADGQPIPAGRALRGGVVRHVGVEPIEVALGGGETVRLAPKGSIAVTTGAGLVNERICVCVCACGSEMTVQIRCDSLLVDCSKLDGNVCTLKKEGGFDVLSNCGKRFVHP